MRVRWGIGAVAVALATLVAAPPPVAADSTVVIGNSGPFSVTVAPGTTIDVELSGRMSLGQPHPYAIPTSSNTAVVAPVSSSTDAQAGTHATFRAVSNGSATLSGSGPSGILCPTGYATPGPGCVAVAAILFRVSVTVTSGTIGGPRVGGAPATDDTPVVSDRSGIAWGVGGGTLAGALVAAALAVRRRRTRGA